MPPVTPNDVQQAANALARAEQAWHCAGKLLITQGHLDEIESKVHRLKAAVQRNSGWQYFGELPRIVYRTACLKVRELAARWNLEWIAAALLLAAVFTFLLMILALVFAKSIVAAIAVFPFAFAIGFPSFIAVLIFPPDQELKAILENARRDRHVRLINLGGYKQELIRAQLQLPKFRQNYELRQKCEQIAAFHQQLIERLHSRKNALHLRQWKDLRGIDFENFLAEVFEVNGYSVQLTKTTGDFGVDLILIKGRFQLAVQAKGYSGSVGPEAVQEVFAGMAHYRCHICAVITNSYFTSGAQTLSESTSCALVDGEGIPALIEGTFVIEQSGAF